MLLRRPRAASPGANVLELVDVDEPRVDSATVVLRVSVCGVCRTDLDIVEGRIAAPRYPVVPGHQIVGHVEQVGDAVKDLAVGDRVGVAWINSACGHCRWCLAGQENLCPEFRATGCDVDGGYAELARVPATFAYRIPDAITDAQAAPLLCAGAIGWRSLRLTGLEDGEPLGLSGFGASAHLVLQLARHRFPASAVSVFARSGAERDFAAKLGATWTGEFGDRPPEPLAAIIDTTPAWRPVIDSLAHLAPGGRLVVNAIRKSTLDQQELAKLDYATHLWMEREIKSVANVTRADVREMLSAAVEIGLRATVTTLPLSAANAALEAMHSAAAVRGATVLSVAGSAGVS